MLRHGLHAEIGPARWSVTVEGTHSCRHMQVVTATANFVYSFAQGTQVCTHYNNEASIHAAYAFSWTIASLDPSKCCWSL